METATLPAPGLKAVSDKEINEQIPGTDWYVCEVQVSYLHGLDRQGRVTLVKRPGGARQIYNWRARYGIDTRWNIQGDGARIGSGSRVPDTNKFPFSTDPMVNNGIRSTLSKWLDSHKGARSLSDLPFGMEPEANGKPIVETRLTAPVPAIVLPVAPSRPKIAAPMEATPIPVPASPAPSNGSNGKLEIVEALVDEIQPFSGQPRREFSDGDSESMGESLGQEEQQQLITVTPLFGVPGKRWELVDGERRYRGAVAKGTKRLQAMVKRYKGKDEQFWASFVANLNRKSHTPYEMSMAVAKAFRMGKTVPEIMVATGLSNCVIYQYIQLQKLKPSLLELLRMSIPPEKRMRLVVANILARVPDQADQSRIWEDASKQPTPGLVKLRVQELAAPILAKLPNKGRKRKPSDRAERVLRILRTAETDMAFLEGLKVEDLEALVRGKGYGDQSKTLVPRMAAISDCWTSLKGRVKIVH